MGSKRIGFVSSDGGASRRTGRDGAGSDAEVPEFRNVREVGDGLVRGEVSKPEGAKFYPGPVLILPGTTRFVGPREALDALMAHVCGDWGDVSDLCVSANADFLAGVGDYCFSLHPLGDEAARAVVVLTVRTDKGCRTGLTVLGMLPELEEFGDACRAMASGAVEVPGDDSVN